VNRDSAASATRSPLLTVDDLRVDVRTSQGVVPILTGVSLAVQQGEVVGLVGESGSGKSMTVRAVMGLLPTTAVARGKITFDGTDLLALQTAELNAIRGRRIAMIFQDPTAAVDPAYTVGEQIAESLRHHLKLSRRAARDRVTELLHMVGIPEPARRASEYPHKFSGGMLQRVCVAIALSCQPELLLADEPTASLDATMQAQVLELFMGLREKLNLSVLLLSHDFGAVASVSDRVVVMYAGEVVEMADSQWLFDRPWHPYTEGLLRSVTTIDAHSELYAIPGGVPLPYALPAGCRFQGRCAYAKQDLCEVGPIPLRQAEGRTVRCLRYEELELKGRQ
jgi:oligopeptide/dipeptide ABC transporter ATP-binding protein